MVAVGTLNVVTLFEKVPAIEALNPSGKKFPEKLLKVPLNVPVVVGMMNLRFLFSMRIAK